MSKTGSSITEFDWLTESMLMELRSMDGEATTSELRERTGVSTGTKIMYRIREKLEPMDLVETEQPAAEPGKIPPKEVTLTSRGEGLADQLLEAGQSDELSISGEVEQLRAEVNKLSSTVEEQNEAIEDLQHRYDQLYEAYEELSESVS